jgi:fimbrial isopeptide formation D2 family protein
VKKILSFGIVLAMLMSLLVAVPVAANGAAIDKTMSAAEGELGDTVHVTIDVTVPTGNTSVVTDTLPAGLAYVPSSSMVDSVAVADPVGSLSYNVGEGAHTIEFDVKVVEAYAWGNTDVVNEAEAVFSGIGAPDSISDTEDFTILMFEQLDKWMCIPKADVMFAIDLSGSMTGEVTTIKSKIDTIIDDLEEVVGDVQFGLITFMDYVGSHSTTESGSVPETYTSIYGNAGFGDYPYMLDQDFTDGTTVKTAIAAMTLGNGEDSPQDYTRIVHESYSDTNISWRADSTRLLILFGDDRPHDTNFDYDNDGTNDNTGADLGDDGAVGGGDDLDFEYEVATAAAAGVHILGIYSGYEGWKYPWTYMADQTGGQYLNLTDVGDLPAVITKIVKSYAQEVELYEDVDFDMTIEVTNPYGWTITEVVISDRFGGDLELLTVDGEDVSLYEPSSKKKQENEYDVPGTDVTLSWSGNTEKVHMTWDVGSLAIDETATLELVISTDINPGQGKDKEKGMSGKNEYTSTGLHEINSGATLKFLDEDGTLLSAYTGSIMVNVVESD